MKALAVISVVIAFGGICFAESDPMLEVKLNGMWERRDYDGIKRELDSAISQSKPDIAALYCARTFYLFIDPNKGKVLDALRKLKQALDDAGSLSFKETIGAEIEKVTNIPDEGFVSMRNRRNLDAFHLEFSDEYPLMSAAIRIRDYR